MFGLKKKELINGMGINDSFDLSVYNDANWGGDTVNRNIWYVHVI